ncbi:MAG: outer membrane lipoprotein-sorting protein [SAR324 cluster bacterium]|nr:outer membrane lipoprotein-sorting protein [SAR324 cluster bacterium]
MKNLKLSLVALSALTTLTLPAIAIAGPAQDKGYKIASEIDAKPVVERSMSENKFLIYNAQDKLLFTKKFRTANFVSDYKDSKKRLSKGISYFYSPADDKGNSALTLEQPKGQEDDQWLYLKGLRKPKRVLGSDKSSSFMGSDFSNGDLARPDLDDSTYTWLGKDTVNFKGKKLKVEKMEVKFKDPQMSKDYGTSKTVGWIHTASGLMFKTEVYNLEGQLYKTMKLLSFKAVKNRDGKKVFTVTGLEMKNALKGTKTVMKVGKMKVEKEATGVKEEMFSLNYLTRRWW